MPPTQRKPLYGNDEFTPPDAALMANGSLGTLKIPPIGLTVSVHKPDDEIEGMAYGVAHLKESSCYAGHVVFTVHNRGVHTYFSQIHTLVEGNKVERTTALGTRVYTVSSSQLIDENDWSQFGRAVDNRISLITCMDNSPAQRLCVQAVEIA